MVGGIVRLHQLHVHALIGTASLGDAVHDVITYKRAVFRHALLLCKVISCVLHGTLCRCSSLIAFLNTITDAVAPRPYGVIVTQSDEDCIFR